MSELRPLLSGEHEPGVYAEPTTSPAAEVRREVEDAGWRFVHLDTAQVADKLSFLDRAAAAFAFPAWFGRNWDAFADSLADVRSARGTVVLWDGWRQFAQTDDQSFGVALDILRQRSESASGGVFVVLLRGEEHESDPGSDGGDAEPDT
jgi:hypothetical protein